MKYYKHILDYDQDHNSSDILRHLFVNAGIGIAGAFVFEIAIDHFATSSGYYEEDEESHEHDEENTTTNNSTAQNVVIKTLDYLLKELGDFSELSNFNLVISSLIALYLLSAIIQFIRGYLIISVEKKIDLKLLLTYYKHIIDLPVSTILVRQTGEYLSRFSDARIIREAISTATLTLIMDSLMTLVCGLILFLQNSHLFIVALLMVFFDSLIVLVFRRPIQRSNRQVMERNAQLQSYLKESIDGIETVKSSNASEKIKQKTTEIFNFLINSVVKNNLITMTQNTIADIVELIGTVIILWIGFYLVIIKQISIGSLITFYALLGYFSKPIKNVIELQPTIQSALVAIDRLNDILDLNLEQDSNNNTIPFPHVNKWICNNLYFRYGNRELTLQNVCLTIKNGEKIAIIGESGSGKTTLAKLILKFYNPEKGEILINNMPIEILSLSELRNNIAYVSQNTFLFSDTIKNNLILGNENISDDDIIKVCKICEVDNFVSELPLKYETPLDENGSNLSGGQRQRISIARALLKQPQLLILDEATSNLDTITETALKNTIFKYYQDLTCIIIAHRLSTIKQCDKIYVMEKGSIVESGTHMQLLKQNGQYSKLWNEQFE